MAGTDKMLVGEYVRDIAEQLLAAFAKIEERYPGWEVGATEIVARGVLKPVREGPVTRVYLDLDEPSRLSVSEIPIPLRRRPGALGVEQAAFRHSGVQAFRDGG